MATGISIPAVAVASPQELTLVAKAMNNNQLVLAANQSGTTTIAGGANNGSGATVTLVGGDASGLITFNSGSTGLSAPGNYFNVTFANAMPVAPAVSLDPANIAAANIASTATPYVVSTTTGFALNGSSAAITASTVYKWYYQVIG